jgi:hypothetical protein
MVVYIGDTKDGINFRSLNDLSKDIFPVNLDEGYFFSENLAANVNLTEADIRRLKDFIVSNYDLLMKHWNQEVSTCDLFDIFKQKYQEKQ